ncbi:uncharacterized protein BO80DRAFT_266371 [Aspergillus ibericus CBS 121593]|uniref:Uncharacterized protein n=1 Tax=Aspergillus ibericus CBS 121593 TaxID=1448316 RepID=A0A395GJC8_9EURO|nr:hypothetical protein BO80DRAFT_266371 [Aspergillus ibericus CBS 121593]RAK95316.1 hypothetical protein BO80DRAFT_266371 [Aspergillus ibericus CBS 121593]
MQRRPKVRYCELSTRFRSKAPCSDSPACSRNCTVCTLMPLPPHVWAIWTIQIWPGQHVREPRQHERRTHNFGAPHVFAAETFQGAAGLLDLGLHLVGVVDAGNGLLDLLIGGILMPHATQRGASLVSAALAHKEIGRLGGEDKADQERHGPNELHQKGNPPRCPGTHVSPGVCTATRIFPMHPA